MSHEISPDLVLRQRPRTVATAAGRRTVLAPAKINLNLLVGPRRGDGFHPLDSLVARVSFYDEIELALRTDGETTITCFGQECGDNQSNLALRAAKALAAGRSVGGVSITLQKRIPAGKGLGGGSSDAAAVLLTLNELWNLNLPAEELAAIGATLGSDVPLFLGTPCARMTGRGEILQPVAIHPFAAVLFLPPYPCATAEVYRAYDRREIIVDQQIDLSLLRDKPSTWRGRLRNHLLPAAQDVAPPLAGNRDALQNALGFVPVCLTGSGSAMFALCDDLAEAQALLAKIPPALLRYCIAVERNDW